MVFSVDFFWDWTETARDNEGEMFISPLIFLMPVIIPEISLIFDSASSSRRMPSTLSAYKGNAAFMMEPCVPGSLCQISSVIKGTKGCSKTSVSCRTRHSTLMVACCRFCPSFPYKVGLIASRYQSQNSCHTNL